MNSRKRGILRRKGGVNFMKNRICLCIDLKSFYASVECVERGLDPMTTNLIVADPERSDKTICLAITPAMKELGIHNRCRVFEIPDDVEYITAQPRMKKYIDYAAEIYAIYLSYVSKDDIHVYSIDEVFIDVTDYLSLYKMTAKELAKSMMTDVYQKLGIRATCGIGTNLYLAKIALDITAKHSPDYIGYLDETLYKKTLWDYEPLTDFWRIGQGTANRLAHMGIRTMRGIAACDEDLLYKKFGIDAELLIDHAHGYEPTTMADIKTYKPKTNCLGSGQVLMRDYTFEEGRLVVKEMMEQLCLDMVEKEVYTKSITLSVGYSNTLKRPSARGSTLLETPTNATVILLPAISELYERIVDPACPVRRMNLSCNNITENIPISEQTELFADSPDTRRNHAIQETMLQVKKHFGKNAVFRASDLEEGATTLERNRQIGGHKSGE